MSDSSKKKSNYNIIESIEKFIAIIAIGYAVSNFYIYEHIDPNILDEIVDKYDNCYDWT